MGRRPANRRTETDGSKPENLHIAITQRIVGRHRNQMRMPLEIVRFIIERLVGDVSKDDARLRE